MYHKFQGTCQKFGYLADVLTMWSKKWTVEKSGRAEFELKIENSNFHPSNLVPSQNQLKMMMSKLLL
jgi:hypothetical protein